VPSLAERSRPSAAERGYCDAKWFAVRRRILLRDEYQCRHCGRVCSGKGEAHVDHIKPKDQGGDDSDANLQVLCRACHARKTVKEHSPVR